MRRNQGFTLIELLTVIAIIAILASMLFPVFSKAREKARGISCVSNLKQAGTAMQMYRQDFDERSPFSSNCAAGLEYQMPQFTLNAYVKNFQVWKCSSDTTVNRNSPTTNPCNTGLARWFSYGFNGIVVNSRDFGDGLPDASVVQPARVIYMMDHTEGDGKFEGNGDGPHLLDTRPCNGGGGYPTRCASTPAGPCQGGNNVACTVFIRHSEGVNALHYDGHVKWYRIWTIRDVQWEWSAN